MAKIAILSWNLKYLICPIKRVSGLDILPRNHIDTAMLQETHLLHKQRSTFRAAPLALQTLPKLAGPVNQAFISPTWDSTFSNSHKN
jgi:hypothetical protein